MTHLEKLYLGKAGELLAAAHLVRHGYNTVGIGVDTGTDLLGESLTSNGERGVYRFQVKTTTKRRVDLQIADAKLAHVWEERVNLIVVSWPQSKAQRTLVIPPSVVYLMSYAVDHGKPLIRKNENGRVLSVSFLISGGVRIPGTRCQLDVLEERYDRCESVNCSLKTPDYLDWNVS